MAGWLTTHLPHFAALETTVDHYIDGGPAQRAAIEALVGRVPLTAHGINLSLGTEGPLDLGYLDKVAATVERLRAPAYSEHLAFTRAGGRDLGNLLPLPHAAAVAEAVIEKVRTVQARVGVPFLLENISYLFAWPGAEMSEVEFLSLICRETGAGLLLDIENLYLNAANHGFDAYAFLDALPAGLVKEMHIAGGTASRESIGGCPMLLDTHSHPVPDGALDLLDHALRRQAPAFIILERDERLDATDEILADLARIRARLAARPPSDADSPQDRALDSSDPARPAG